MIKIIEVGPRDGLQNEPVMIPTHAKIAFVDALSATGAAGIEVSAFVSPKWVPQLADASAVFAGIERREGVSYSALVPNSRGLDRALECSVDKIAVFTAASEGFCRRNTNCTIDESFSRMELVLARARDCKMPVRGYVSTAFHCPYDGRIDPEDASRVIEKLADLGVTDVSIGDTIGRAVPEEVSALLDVVTARVSPTRLAMHFHDTYGQAAANVLRSFKHGVEIFDACAGGIGGCPYAPGAPGNVATAMVAKTLSDAGAKVTMDFDALKTARGEILQYLQRAGAKSPPSRGL